MAAPDKNALRLTLAPMGLKVCWYCESLLRFADFNKKATTPDGLQRRCRSCQNKHNLSDYYTHNDKRIAKSNEWHSNNPDKVRVAVRRSSAMRDPARKAAQTASSLAHRRGEIAADDYCSVCGRDDALQMHHESYEKDKWLDVKWLCDRCHRIVHRKSGEE